MSLKIGSNIVVSNSRRVDIEDLYLTSFTIDQLRDINGTSVGDIAYCSDIDQGRGALVFWTGSTWEFDGQDVRDLIVRTDLLYSVEGSSYSGSGTTWQAEYGDGTFTLVSSPAYNSSTPSYLNFNENLNGINQYAYGNGSFTADSRDFSWEVWYRSGTAAGEILVGVNNRQTGTPNNYDRMIYLGTDGKLYFGCYTGSTTTISSEAGMNDNNWRQVVGIYRNPNSDTRIDLSEVPGTISLYINGLYKSSVSCGNITDIGTRYLTVAGGRNTSWPAASGAARHYTAADIGIVRFYWGHALSGSEIEQNYNSRKSSFGL